jgi:hypothetical protein
MKRKEEYFINTGQGKPKIIPEDVDLNNISLDLFNDARVGEGAKLTLPCFDCNAPGIKFRFFSASTLAKNATVEIEDFTIEKSVTLLPDLNSTFGEGAKVKISTTRLTVFNKLKEISDTNPMYEVSLKPAW